MQYRQKGVKRFTLPLHIWMCLSAASYICHSPGKRRRMGHRTRVAVAAVTVTMACCVASVMSRVLLSAPAARNDHATQSWLTNILSEQQEEDEEEEKRKEVLLETEEYQAADTINEQQPQEDRQVIGRTDRQIFPPSNEQQEKRAKEEVVGRGSHQTAPSRQHQRADNKNLDYLFKSAEEHPQEAQRLLWEDHHDPEVTPGFFQGDMMGVNAESLLMNMRVGLKWEVFPEKRWINATVPYVISDLYGASEHQMILTALNTLNFLTCIKFVPWDRVARDYLLIWPMKQPRGCWSFVGKKGGRQILSLQPPDSSSKRCFVSLGKPIHEMLHALGVFHEQARPDRDDYIDIIKENIIPEYIHNFNKASPGNTTYPFTYDYDSVMHYGNNFFSFNRNRPTIVPKKIDATIGQRIMLSKLDCLKVNDLYGCLDDPFDREKYSALCTYLGY